MFKELPCQSHQVICLDRKAQEKYEILLFLENVQRELADELSRVLSRLSSPQPRKSKFDLFMKGRK